jgi:putative membrane protein
MLVLFKGKTNMIYLFIKSLHIVGVVAWFAGLFYIFRLFVYHVENSANPQVTQVLEVMERKLFRAITTPAMIFTVLMGLTMLSLNPSLLNAGWFRLKLFALIFLFGYHFYAGHVRKEFLKKNFILTSRQCRIINEVPAIILLIVVPLAVMKAF